MREAGKVLKSIEHQQNFFWLSGIIVQLPTSQSVNCAVVNIAESSYEKRLCLQMITTFWA